MPNLIVTTLFIIGSLPLLYAPPAVHEESSAAPSTTDEDAEKNVPAKDEKTQPACITHSSQARYVSGYNHLVTIKNDCDKSASCQVSTDVNPEVQTVIVQKKTSETVLTYRGSPARTFVANVECRLDG